MKKLLTTLVLSTLLIFTLLGFCSCEMDAGGDSTTLPKPILTSASLAVEDFTISGRVSNDTEAFNFSQDITVKKRYSWVLSTDLYGMNIIASKNAPLNEGENTFYIHVTNTAQEVQTFTVNIYRNHLYTVEFNTDGGTAIEAQTVEEGQLASAPESASHPWFTFDSWSYDFNTPITESVTVNAVWKESDALANLNYSCTDTTFTVTGVKDTTVTEIIVPDCVTHVSEGAFAGCSSLESITLPFVGDSVRTEEDSDKYPFGYIFGTEPYADAIATEQPYRISNVADHATYYLPASLTTVSVTGGNILSDAFRYCSNLKEVSIPLTATSIGDYAFSDCIHLTSVTIPNNVIDIGETAFGSCLALTEITIPKSVTKIDEGAFAGCSGLQTLIFEEGGSSTIIVAQAFVNCTSLSSVVLSNSVTTIGSAAFMGCASLTSIVIPNSVTTIDGYAFADSGLISITLSNSITTISSSLFSGCKNLSSVVIPNSVTTIGLTAFSGTGLTSVIIPNNVTRIGEFAFSNCTNLTSVVIPNSVTAIGEYAFYCCSNLTSITLPNNLTTITSCMFRACAQLTSIVIPNSVTTIEYGAFMESGLVSITIPASVATICPNTFFGTPMLESIIFEDTTTWYVTLGATLTNGTLIDVSNPIQNAIDFQKYPYYLHKE